jgi:2-enoate reductase
MKTKYANLFTPFRVGNVEVKNRFHLASMGGMVRLKHNSEITPETMDYFVRVARGGVGIVATPPWAVYHAGPKYLPGETFVTEDDMDLAAFGKSLKTMADKIHAYGAKLMCQLTLGTFELQIPGVFSPSVGINKIDINDIQKYLDAYRKASILFKNAGVDIIEVHAIHTGYILDQFCSEVVNHRTDAYGGSLENRCRLAVQILHTLKETCGQNYPVTIKLGAKSEIYDFNPKASDPKDRVKVYHRGIEESFAIGQYLAKAGYDAINCDGIGFSTNDSCYFPKGMGSDQYKRLHDTIGVPLLIAGRLNDPELASSIIDNKIADCISLGRQMLADPEFVNKLRANRENDIRYCLSCNEACFNHVINGIKVSCAINPRAGIPENLTMLPAFAKKNILIVGGGIAGMEAARVAATRGHHVSLYEKKGDLGGVFIAAAAFDFKEDDRKLIAWYKRQIENLGVDIHLNSEITAPQIEKLAPDVVIVSTGASPINLPIEGIDYRSVATATNFLLGNHPVGEKIVIIGGGLTGCEIAYAHAKQGKQVFIVEMLDDILSAPGIPSVNVQSLKYLLDKHGVKLYVGTKVIKIGNTGVTIAAGNTEQVIPADTVVTAVGYTSDTKLYDSLRDYAGELYLLGDAQRVSNLKNAVWNGYELANNL